MRSRFHWFWHHIWKNRSIHARELHRRVVRIARQQLLQHLERRVLVADRRILDGFEKVVRHEVGLVGLFLTRAAQLGGRLLRVDRAERGNRLEIEQALGLHPLQPVAQERLVDAAERCEPAGGVAVHRRVADRGLGAIRRREQHGAAQVREHPDRRRSHARLNVLQREVVVLPRQLAADRLLERGDVRLVLRVDVDDVKLGADGFRDRFGRALRVTGPEFSVG